MKTLILNTTNIVPNGLNNQLIFKFPNSVLFKKSQIAFASCSIYYNARENVFSLPKFENITEEDIVKATKYLMRNYYDCWLIFNIRFVEPKDDDNRFNFKPNRIKKFFRKLTGQI